MIVMNYQHLHMLQHCALDEMALYKSPNYLSLSWLSICPYLPDPTNFVPFGMMRYSDFAINLINNVHEYNLPMICICLLLNKASGIPLSNNV